MKVALLDRKYFYRKLYENGYYSLEKLIEIYQDYETQAEDWKNSFQYENFIEGQIALLQVINEIKDKFCNKKEL